MAANQKDGDGSRRGPFEHTREHSSDPEVFKPKPREGEDIHGWERTREHEPPHRFHICPFSG